MRNEYRVKITRINGLYHTEYQEVVDGTARDTPSDDVGRMLLERNKRLAEKHNFKDLTTTFEGESW